MRRTLAVALVALLWPALTARADQITRDLQGSTPGGQPVALRVVIDFAATGGDFSANLGTATVRFTLRNTSLVFPFQSPPMGNPLLTGFFFNVPPGTGITYAQTKVFGGATLWSAGTNIGGSFVPPGCHVIAADTLISDWYALSGQKSTGVYGVFTNQLDPDKSNKPALAVAGLFAGCVPQGTFTSPLVIAGDLEFTLLLDHLGPMMTSAAGFLSQCSTDNGSHVACSLGAKFQGTDAGAIGSAFIGDPCQPTALLPSSWGTLRTRYR